MDIPCLSRIVKPPKKFVFIFNFIFSLLGFTLIGLGSYVHVVANDYLHFLGGSYLNTSILIIVIGPLTILIVILGCYASSKECKRLMVSYSFLLLAMIISQIGASIASFVLKGELGGSIERNMMEALNHYGENDQNDDTLTWDRVQIDFHCCGVSNWKDWKKSTSSGLPFNTVPDSCCIQVEENCGQVPTGSQVNTEGCYDQFTQKFSSNLEYVGATTLAMAITEIIILSLGCWQGKKFRDGGAS